MVLLLGCKEVSAFFDVLRSPGNLIYQQRQKEQQEFPAYCLLPWHRD